MAGNFNQKSLIKRTLSALVLIPLTVLIIFMGGWYFKGLLFIAAFICLYEWIMLSLKTKRRALLVLAGFLYIPVSFFAGYVLHDSFGPYVAILFMVLVWASDSGAYFMGKTIGGFKLLKEVSPNKTWAGFLGAILTPAIMAGLYLLVVGSWQNAAILALPAGVVIGVFGQWGDLIASSLKRIAGEKDSGKLIPGHGGLLDRMDAVLLTAPVFLFFLKVFAYAFAI